MRSKTSIILNVVLAVAVGILAVKAFSTPENGNTATEGNNAAIKNIMTRTSIRAYEAKPVEAEKLDQLLRAGMAAPSAVNKQPWDFIVVQRSELLKELADSLPNMAMAAKAPLAIVVCGNMQKTMEGQASAFWIQDCSAAAENILLAAHALGLGAVWTAVTPDMQRTQAAKTVLDLPSYIVPLCVIPIGYPAESPSPKDKWKPENVHYDGWENKAGN